MGFSFIALYEWLLGKEIADKEVPTDDFIQKGLNGFNSSIFVRWYDKHKELEAKLRVAVTDLELMEHYLVMTPLYCESEHFTMLGAIRQTLLKIKAKQ